MKLSKGVFWVADRLYPFRIFCNERGDIVGQTQYPLNSKDGRNYNHKLLWGALPKTITCGKQFDYFPRGRVEIKNAKATVYLNPDINTEEMQRVIVKEYGLSAENGIDCVRFVSDGSQHYKYKRGEDDDDRRI